MFSDRNYETLLKEKLDNVPDDIDKREGSVIYNALAPNSLETQQLYMVLQWVYRQLDPRTADYENLIRWASPFGILPHASEPAIVIGEFDKPIEVGTRFNWEDINFVMVNTDTLELVAETHGALSIKAGDILSPIDPITGLSVSRVKKVVAPGRAFETHESFLGRLPVELERQAYGGNIADYERMVLNIPGVGNVKVKRAVNGPGTVGLTIIDSDFNVPSQELVQRVQEAIDPTGFQGQGLGLAPIDHTVTVLGAVSEPIDIGLHITYAPGYNTENAQDTIKNTIESYLKEIRANWKSGKLVVYISQIESRILKLDAVTDIGHTTLNGSEDNYMVATDAIPVLGSVVVE